MFFVLANFPHVNVLGLPPGVHSFWSESDCYRGTDGTGTATDIVTKRDAFFLSNTPAGPVWRMTQPTAISPVKTGSAYFGPFDFWGLPLEMRVSYYLTDQISSFGPADGLWIFLTTTPPDLDGVPKGAGHVDAKSLIGIEMDWFQNV